MMSKVGEQVCNNSVQLGVLRSMVEVYWESSNTRGTMTGHRVKGSHHLCHSEWGDGHGQELMLQPGVKLTRPKCTKDRSKMLTKILHRGDRGRGQNMEQGPEIPLMGCPKRLQVPDKCPPAVVADITIVTTGSSDHSRWSVAERERFPRSFGHLAGSIKPRLMATMRRARFGTAQATTDIHSRARLARHHPQASSNKVFKAG